MIAYLGEGMGTDSVPGILLSVMFIASRMPFSFFTSSLNLSDTLCSDFVAISYLKVKNAAISLKSNAFLSNPREILPNNFKFGDGHLSEVVMISHHFSCNGKFTFQCQKLLQL